MAKWIHWKGKQSGNESWAAWDKQPNETNILGPGLVQKQNQQKQDHQKTHLSALVPSWNVMTVKKI